MKYGVYINQAGVADAGLAKATDFIDWAIISYIHDWQTAPRAARMGDLVWINYKHLIDEMPLLGLNSKTSISSRMSKLKELGLIEVGYDKDKRLYARISDRCHEIILFRSDCTPNSGAVRQYVQGVRGDVQGGVRQDVHSTVKYISTDNQEHRPPDGANLEKINSLQKKDCAKSAHTDPPARKGELKSTLWGQNEGVAAFEHPSGSGVAGKPSKPASGATGQMFDTFWQVYPKRVAKGAAIKAFNSAMKVATFSEIMDGVRRYAQTRPDPKYTPHPSTWLNQQRWADEIKEEANGKAISRSNAAPTKTDRLNAVIADAIANPPDLSIWGRPRAAYQHDRPMLSGPQSVREGTRADGGGDQDISPGAGGLPH